MTGQVDQKLREAVDAHMQGRIEEAESLYKDVLQRKPRDVVALHHMGVIHYHRGDFDTAIDLIQKSLAVHANYPEAYCNLGLALVAKKRVDEAIVAFDQAIRLNPNNPESYNNLSSAFLAQNLAAKAAEACQKAIELKPDFALAHYNLGVALQRLGRLEAAIAAFQKALLLFPDLPEAYCNLGLSYVDLGRLEEGIAAYRRAIELRPNFPEAYNNLGQPLSDLRRSEEATEAYLRAVELRPHYTDALNNLACIYRRRGMLKEAMDACQKAVNVDPHNTKALIELLNLRRHVCDWSSYDADMRQMMAHSEDVEPFILLNAPSSPADQLRSARKWSARQKPGVPFSYATRKSSDKIRIGYLSSDFRRHATAYLMAELFERHDRERFELYAYSYGFDDGSEVRQRLIQAFDQFVDIQRVFHGAAAQRINDDKIDILVDLKGYTGDTRTEILVNRPAPIQVNYLGYPGTLGADFIDYIVADSYVAPMEHQPFYTEKIVQLPSCYQPNDTKRRIAARTPTRSQCKLPEEGLVFCSFNGSYKITPVFFDIWMRLLKAAPGSVLWLLSTTPLVEENLRREAHTRGVDPERLVFAEGMVIEDHLARHRLADLFLDTLPIGAHTTASDALWAGLPVLTCQGEAFVGRVAASLLAAVGMPELIAKSLVDYEAIALDLATHPARLTELKHKLARQLPNAPLFDIEGSTRALESAYGYMYDLWRAGDSPKPFRLEPAS